MQKLKMLKQITWMKFFNVLMIANFIVSMYFSYIEIRETICMSKTSYIGYKISDFLINWQGGYVRRGLVGELLYCLCEATHWQPTDIIVVICIISYIAFTVVFWTMLKTANISWWILFLPFTLGGMPVIRKDHICMFLVLVILRILKANFKFVWVKLLCLYMVYCLLLHIHEAFFFVIFPFAVLYLYFHDFSAFSNRLLKLTLSVFPFVVSFLFVCYYHGDENTAHAIYLSWIRLCPSLVKYEFTYNDSIGAVGWTTITAVIFHLKQGYFIKTPLVWILIYYLMSRFLTAFNTNMKNIVKKQIVFNVILQFQFIAILPLFTIFSCDVDRICMYWTVSSICIYCMLRTEIWKALSNEMFVLNVLRKFDSLFDHIFIPSKVLLCLLILFITVPQVGSGGVPGVYNGFVRGFHFLLKVTK